MTPEQLTLEFENCRKQLRSYLLRMTASRQDAEDLSQETWLRAFEKINTFRADSSPKTWLFSIAHHLSLDLLRSRKRWPENVTDICREKALSNREFLQHLMGIRMNSPQGQFEIREHIVFCFTCISQSLPLEQQVVLLLKEVCEFKTAEIASIVDKTEAAVKHLLHNARKKMVSVFDNRCSLINKQGACHQCTELNGIFNPRADHQKELMKIEMAREGNNPDRDRLLDLRMKIVAAIDPFESPAAELQLAHLQHNKEVMDQYAQEIAS